MKENRAFHRISNPWFTEEIPPNQHSQMTNPNPWFTGNTSADLPYWWRGCNTLTSVDSASLCRRRAWGAGETPWACSSGSVSRRAPSAPSSHWEPLRLLRQASWEVFDSDLQVIIVSWERFLFWYCVSSVCVFSLTTYVVFYLSFCNWTWNWLLYRNDIYRPCLSFLFTKYIFVLHSPLSLIFLI